MKTPTPTLDPAFGGSLLQQYAPLPGAWDEVLAPDGGVRDAWAFLAQRLDSIGAGELARRWHEARRLMREDGITYNVEGDPRGLDRPWDFDPIPHVLSNGDWEHLERGVAQRADLLNRVLLDLYGPQRLLREGLLPADVVFGHPGFLRPVHGLRVPRDRHLHLYAVDVARRPDGSWCVLRDHTQAPYGAGYALENRLTTLRMLPEVYHEAHVRRLMSFFEKLQQSLAQLAPSGSPNPRIVLLTPGTSDQSYSEHVYLARFLGCTLAEGSDLAVRDNAVYLKTLGGLVPVDVVLRRVEDHLCDPLEMRYESESGVPGLVQAAHAGNVAIANALGSGLLNSPALMPFLERLAAALLGETLLLPSARTLWSGHGAARENMLEHLGELVIKPAFHEGALDTVFGVALSDQERAGVAARIRARGTEFVAQEQVTMSTAPVWSDSGLQPRHVVVRLYAVATDDGYHVMRGGLTRFSGSATSLSVTLASGGGSKDTWVLGDGPTTAASLLQHVTQVAVPLARSGLDMPSRVAEHLYWLGRYVERAEQAVRVLRTTLGRLTVEGEGESAPELAALLDVVSALRLSPLGLGGPGPFPTGAQLDQHLLEVVYSQEITGNLPAICRLLRATVWMVRDRVSVDAWRILSQIDRGILNAPAANRRTLAGALVLMNDMLAPLLAFGGLAMENTTRGPGWRFLDLGRRIERASTLVTLLRAVEFSLVHRNAAVMQALLELADSSMTYRSRYLSSLQLAPVLDLLVLDETNPRSLAFQLVAMADHIDSLPRLESAPESHPEHRMAMSVLMAVRVASAEDLAEGEQLPRLVALLGQLKDELPALSDVISRRYFAHAEFPRRLTLG